MIAFFTYDLFEGRERLMPWRTIIEVCRTFQEKYGTDVCIFSLDRSANNDFRFFQNVKIYSVNRKCYFDVSFFAKYRIESVYFPVVWRSSKRSILPFVNFKGNKVAYFPAGVYSRKQVIYALKYVDLKVVYPYIVEAYIPKWRVISFLKKSGFNKYITLSNLTKTTLLKLNIDPKNVRCIPPGIDLIDKSDENEYIEINSRKYAKDEYFFFMGGPAKIRGLELLLRSFEKACELNDDLRLLCLIRNDPGYNLEHIHKLKDNLKFKNNIDIILNEVDRNILMSLIAKSRAVVLPFLLIPSEIPLTYFEVLSMNATIISLRNGGSTEFLNDSIFICDHSTNSLSKTILEVSQNSLHVVEKKRNAKLIMNSQLYWPDVGEKWHSMLQNKK